MLNKYFLNLKLMEAIFVIECICCLHHVKMCVSYAASQM